METEIQKFDKAFDELKRLSRIVSITSILIMLLAPLLIVLGGVFLYIGLSLMVILVGLNCHEKATTKKLEARLREITLKLKPF